jgi:hypothetical protein
MNRFPSLAFALPLLAFAVAQPSAGARLAQEEDFAFEVGTEAYVYAFPMMMMEMTRRVSTNVESPIGVFAPMNQFAHLRGFPDHTFREVVRPNVDTLYSIVWFDVSEEPLVLSIPQGTERYHMMPMLDMWTDVFAAPGTRTTGSAGGHFAIMGPRWSGELPAGVQGIRSPTSMGWIIGRTKTNGSGDYETVHAIQDGYRLVPLSRFGRPASALPAGRVDPSFDMGTPPLAQVERMSAEDYFELFAELLVANPPHEMDWPILARLRRIGFVAGETFDLSALDAGVREALERGAKRGQELIEQHAEKAGTRVNGWSIMFDGMGTYGGAYLQRANIARIGIGANLVEDALYPMTFLDNHGEPYDGSRSYRLHLAAEALPPVQGFWSLTMYDAEMYLADNPIGRYAIGDRDELRFSEDGSLDILVQHEPPTEEQLSNWLPAPPGRFDMVLRLYWPRREVLTGEWVPPAVTRSDESR